MTHSIRHSLRSVVEATGHQIRKTDVYSSQRLRYRRLFSLLDLNLILDVGANAGQFATLCRTIGYRGNILSFEPSSTAYQKLLAAASSDPLWTVAGVALGATTGEAEINVSADSFCSSILPMLDSHLSAAPRSGYLHKEKVSIRRLDDVLPPPAFTSKALLKLDVQGFELQVLTGAPRILSQALAVQLEMSLLPLYQGETLMPEMSATMCNHGFQLWDLEPSFRDPATGRLLQVDGIFVRNSAIA
jgi:FkbM family methyltransferase